MQKVPVEFLEMLLLKAATEDVENLDAKVSYYLPIWRSDEGRNMLRPECYIRRICSGVERVISFRGGGQKRN